MRCVTVVRYVVDVVPLETIASYLEDVMNDKNRHLEKVEKVSQKIGKEENVYYLVTVKVTQGSVFYP